MHVLNDKCEALEPEPRPRGGPQQVLPWYPVDTAPVGQVVLVWVDVKLACGACRPRRADASELAPAEPVDRHSQLFPFGQRFGGWRSAGRHAERLTMSANGRALSALSVW
jgi:hypothetical protein